MKTVNCEGVEYLNHQSEGNAARWIMPLAKYYCKGENGADIGPSKVEWAFPGANIYDPELTNTHAMNLMVENNYFDYIFSSHCLEHVKENWMTVLDYWLRKIKVGGILFLYLPHASQNYWQPRNNRKHIHSFYGPEINDYLNSLGHQSFVSGVDMNHSFTVICEKRDSKDSTLKCGDGAKIWDHLPFEPEFGSKEYYEQKAKVIADEKEKYCIERNLAYIREGNNVIYNDPWPIKLAGWHPISHELLNDLPTLKEILDKDAEDKRILFGNKLPLTKKFFEQNNIDLQNKIKEYTEQLDPFNIEVEIKSTLFRVNKIRTYYNLSPLSIEEMSKQLGV